MSTENTLPHLALTTTLGGKCSNYPHFMEENTEMGTVQF